MGKDLLMGEAATLDMLLLERDEKLNIQVLFQLLMDKKIITEQEIIDKRDLVSRYSSTIRNLDKQINELRGSVNNQQEFLDLYSKMKSGGKDGLTPEEKARFLQILESDRTKYGSLIRDFIR